MDSTLPTNGGPDPRLPGEPTQIRRPPMTMPDGPACPPHPLGRTKFETELAVRPDDIDMYQHVHASRYFDYVLAARYEQMARCYGMSMEAFGEAGYGWYTRASHIEYRRPLLLGDRFIVRTWIEEFHRDGVRVDFALRKTATGKLVCDGWCQYTLVSLETGRAEPIPDWIRDKYAI